MIEVLDLIWKFISYNFQQIWILYAGGGVLGLTLVLWILDHFFDIFDILKR